jgi:hypothetical protein
MIGGTTGAAGGDGIYVYNLSEAHTPDRVPYELEPFITHDQWAAVCKVVDAEQQKFCMWAGIFTAFTCCICPCLLSHFAYGRICDNLAVHLPVMNREVFDNHPVLTVANNTLRINTEYILKLRRISDMQSSLSERAIVGLFDSTQPTIVSAVAVAAAAAGGYEDGRYDEDDLTALKSTERKSY